MASRSRCRACWGGPGLSRSSNHRCPPTNEARCCSARTNCGMRWQASRRTRTHDEVTAGPARAPSGSRTHQKVPGAAIRSRVTGERRTAAMDEHSVSDATTPPKASSQLVVALFGLTFVTGVIDAVSFLGLGHVFTANMTGNIVFLGFAMGGTADLSVGRSLAALCAFASGSVVGGRLTNGPHRTPLKYLLIAMYA